MLIIVDPSIIIRNWTSNNPEPKNQLVKSLLHLDILRGFMRNFGNQTKNMIVVLDTPQIACGKECSFHFLGGYGDSSHISYEIVLWLVDRNSTTEFQITWKHRP